MTFTWKKIFFLSFDSAFVAGLHHSLYIVVDFSFIDLWVGGDVRVVCIRSNWLFKRLNES